MANSELISLVNTYLIYGAESTYGTVVSTTSTFGGLINNGTIEVDREVQEHAGMAGTGTTDGRITAKFTAGTVKTRASLEFKAQQFDWLEYALLGTKTGSGTTGSPYVYSLGKTAKSLTLTENFDNVTTDSKRTFAGMVIDEWSIRCSVGEPANVSLTLMGGKLAKTTTVATAVAQYTDDLYNFSGGTIEMPDATSIGNVIDSVEISGRNNYTVLYGFSYEAVNAKPGRLNLSIKFTLKYLDDDQMDRLMGSSTAITSQTPVTLALKFTKGASGVYYTDFVFTDVVISRIQDSHNLNEFVIEDNDAIASSLQVTEAKS